MLPRLGTTPTACTAYARGDASRCASFLTQIDHGAKWLQRVVSLRKGHSVPPTTTACAIISIAVMVAIQLCGCLLQYLLELRERILFFERKVPQAQVHPPWNMLCTWVAWHFMLALGGVFTMLGLLL